MDQTTFNRLLRRSYSLPLVAMLLLAAVLLWQISVLVSAMRWVQHTHQVTTDARSLMRAILDMETSLRGFLLTGDSRFLEPYHTAEPTVASLFGDLDNLIVEPEQRERLHDMHTTFDTWRAYSQEMIAVRQRGGPYQSPELNLRGKTLMDHIRVQREEFLQHEESAREQRVLRVQSQTRLVFISGTVLALSLGLLLSLYMRRQMLSLSHSYSSAVEMAESNAAQLRETNEFITTALASIADGVIATDKEGHIAFMNHVAEVLTGWRWQDASSKPLSDILHLEPRLSHDAAEDPIARVLRDQSGAVTDSQERLVRGEQSISVEVSAAPIRQRDGAILGTVVTFRDVTQRQQSEHALRTSERLAALGRLASSMAHEINNPLDSLANLLYLLEHQAGLDNAGREQVKLASEELERITQIARNMLGFHRMAAAPVSIQLTEILDTVLVLYSGRLHAAGVEAIKRYDAPGTVVAQPVEMRQVFANLIANAVDASPVGGRIVVHVRTGCDWRNPSKEGVRVFIGDTGVGIPREDQSRIMEAFFTTKGQRGNGLGLWVTRGIVEKYGGAIRFRSSTREHHHGTVFSIFLPSEGAERSAKRRSRVMPLAS
jgi:PAS domain S-box-containing protein